MLKNIAKATFFLGLVLVILSQNPTLLHFIQNQLSSDTTNSVKKQNIESFQNMNHLHRPRSRSLLPFSRLRFRL